MYAAGIVFFTFVLLFIMFWILAVPRVRNERKAEKTAL